MTSRYVLTVSLTEHFCGFVAEQVAAGRFRTASEVVRAGLRLLEQDPTMMQPDPGGSHEGLEATADRLARAKQGLNAHKPKAKKAK